MHPNQASRGPSNQIVTDVSLQLGDVAINDVDDKQRERLEYFMRRKKELGDLRGDEDFEKLSELGAGNGGVVHCVRHKPTGKIDMIQVV